MKYRVEKARMENGETKYFLKYQFIPFTPWMGSLNFNSREDALKQVHWMSGHDVVDKEYEYL